MKGNYQNYRELLNSTINLIGKDHIIHLYIAMFVDMYAEENPFGDVDFDRVCNYILGVYDYNHDTILEDIVFTVHMFLKTNPIEVLEDIKYKEFIYEFLGIEERA